MVFFPKSSAEEVCQMTYLPWQNFTCSCNRKELQQNCMQMQSLLLLIINFTRPESSRTNSAAVHHISICGSHWTREIQPQIAEQGLRDCHEGRKELLFLFLVIFGLFFEALTLLFNHITWSKQLMQSHHFHRCRCNTYRASAVDEMKIEPAMILFMESENTTSSKMVN